MSQWDKEQTAKKIVEEMKQDRLRLKELLDELRDKFDIDVAVMALSLLEDALAIQQGTIDEWEVDDSYIESSKDRLEKICSALGTTSQEFIDENSFNSGVWEVEDEE